MRRLLLLFGLAAACADQGPGDGSMFGSGNDGSSSGADESDGSTTGEADSDDSSSEAGAKFDVAGDTEGIDCECGSQLDFSYIWVANSVEATVSKINTVTMEEEGRYRTHPDSAADPSRTSVSLSGQAVAVANRYGGVTKIWADPQLCDPDTNGVAGLQTSNGKNNVLPWQQDDCIAWHTPFDNVTSQRPIAFAPGGEVDPDTCQYVDEKLWTSACNKFAGGNVYVFRLDGRTGAVEDTIEVEGMACFGLGGYGGAVDGDGDFWITSWDEWKIARIDAETLEPTVYDSMTHGYGITVDHEDRVWLACSSTSGGCSAARFDPETEVWDFATAPLYSGQSGIQQDAHGRMWLNSWTLENQNMRGVYPVDVETMEIGDLIELPAAGKGLSVDLDGNVWTISTHDTATRVDPDTLEIQSYDGLDHPYTYSDMTGWALQNAFCKPQG